MASKILSFDQTKLFKSIEISSNNAHPDKKTISLGLTKINPSESFLSNTINWSLKGRTTTISVEDADRIALLISNQIRAPVAVIVGFKANKLEAKLQTHPETDEQCLGFNREEGIYAPLALEFKNIERFRTVVQFLEKQHYISPNDSKMLDPVIKEIEGSNLSSIATTPTLKIALQAAVGTCIDDIINLCVEADSRDALLGKDNTWLDIREPFNKQAIARAILFESCQSCQGFIEEVFLDQFKGLKTGYNAAKKIQDIYERGLESTRFEGVPPLDVQRAILGEIIEEKLNEKFGAEYLEELPEESNPTLVKALRRRLFADGYSLDMISVMYSGSEKVLPQLQIDPFGATIDAMEGEFVGEMSDSFVPGHNWTLHDGTVIEGEAAQRRFEQIRAEVEATLARSPSVATSTSTSINNS